MTEDITIMEAEPGENVVRFAGRMIVEATRTGTVVLGEHNQHTLEARTGMTREQVPAPWNEYQRRSYCGND